MAVNLATKYSSQIAEVFTAGSFVKGKTSTSFDLTGVKTLKVYTPITVPEVDYTREGTSRYGTVTEMQDIVQELKMTQDKAFTLTIDKGNHLDQNMTKKAADMLRLQINEQSTPAADKYALKRFVTMAGTIETLSAAPTKDTIVELISTGAQTLDDNLVPDGDRYVYVPSEVYKMIRLSPEFTGLEGLGVKAVAKGVCGEIAGLNIVRVPKSYMPSGCWFLITHKNAVLMPYKISDAKVHNDPVGVSGALIEGRHYYDAFVLGAKAAGVYAAVDANKKLAMPTISTSNGKVVIAQSDADEIYYTIDGSDPRYSDSARVYSSSFNGTTSSVCAVAFAEDSYPSSVAKGS